MLDGPLLAEPQIRGGGDVRHVSYGTDAGLFVEFRMENVHMAFASEQAGKPVYEAKPYIRMYIPGDRTKVIDREVRAGTVDVPGDAERFPAQWARFRAGLSAVQDGLPLAEWPLMTTGQVKELNALNIYTVEALAAISDMALGGLGHGGRHLRDQAQAKLALMRDEAPAMAMAAEKADLQRQIDELKAALAVPSGEPERRGPGRPRKAEAD